MSSWISYNHRRNINRNIINTIQTTINKNNIITNSTIQLIKIYTTKEINNIALDLKYILDKHNINNEIVYNITFHESVSPNNTLYIILFNNLIYIPKRFILYQLEQYESDNINININLMNKADYIWEISRYNTNKYKHISNDKILITPLPYINIDNKIENSNTNYEYDIFFFGAYNKRRLNILEKLNDKYKIYYSNNIFGFHKKDIIYKSKIILNLHYYKDAVLETNRINEALQYNKIILSEKSNYTDKDTLDLYDELIIYFDEIHEDLSNIEQLYNKIDYILNNNIEINDKIINEKKNKLSEITEYKILNNLQSYIK